MQKLNKLVFSLLFITTQLIYGSSESTVVRSTNSRGHTVVTVTYTNPSHHIIRSISTYLPSGGYTSSFEYRNGTRSEATENEEFPNFLSNRDATTRTQSPVVDYHIPSQTRPDSPLDCYHIPYERRR